MATYGNPSFAAPARTVATRPMTATLGYLGALAAGVFSIIGAVLLMVDAKELATRTTADVLGTDPTGAGDDLVQGVIDDAAHTLVVRGILCLVFGALIVVFALAARQAALWARILLILVLLGGVGADLIVARDVAPAATKALDVIAIIVSLVVIVLTFLPATNRFGAARKRAA